MAKFVINNPVVTATPNIEVTSTGADALKPGRHNFQLIVVDDAGNQSKPTIASLIVVDNQAPTAVLIAPPTVSNGSSFQLDGSRSFDVGGGKIVQYIWTYLGQ